MGESCDITRMNRNVRDIFEGGNTKSSLWLFRIQYHSF